MVAVMVSAPTPCGCLVVGGDGWIASNINITTPQALIQKTAPTGATACNWWSPIGSWTLSRFASDPTCTFLTASTVVSLYALLVRDATGAGFSVQNYPGYGATFSAFAGHTTTVINCHTWGPINDANTCSGPFLHFATNGVFHFRTCN